MEMTTQMAMPITELPEAEAQDPYILSPTEASELVAGHPRSQPSAIASARTSSTQR